MMRPPYGPGLGDDGSPTSREDDVASIVSGILSRLGPQETPRPEAPPPAAQPKKPFLKRRGLGGIPNWATLIALAADVYQAKREADDEWGERVEGTPILAGLYGLGAEREARAKAVRDEEQARLEKQEAARERLSGDRQAMARTILPTVLARVYEKAGAGEKKSAAQATSEYVESQSWFQALPEKEQVRIRKKIVRAGEEEEDLSPEERAYASAKGRYRAESEFDPTRPREPESARDRFRRDYYKGLMTRTPGPLEENMTPEKALKLTDEAANALFPPSALPAGQAQPMAGEPQVTGTEDLPPHVRAYVQQYPVFGQVLDLWKNGQLPPGVKIEIPGPTGPPAAGTVPQAGGLPMRPLIDYRAFRDQILQRMGPDGVLPPDAMGALNRVRQAFLQDFGFDPEQAP